MTFKRYTKHLRKGRVSIPHARYFVTLCTKNRKADLTSVAAPLIGALRELQMSDDIDLHCATLMPDHLHMLFTLRDRLTLAQTVAKYKVATKQVLLAGSLEWQANYYDHRLRFEDSMESFARYIFLNPYRKQLIGSTTVWPAWVLNQSYKPEFISFLKNEQFPPPEWIQNHQTLDELIEKDRPDD